MPPLTPSNIRKGRRGRLMREGFSSVHLSRLGLLFGALGGRLLRLGLRRRTIAPLHQAAVDLLHRNPGGLALAGLDLGARALHELLGAVRRDQDTAELAIDGRALVLHLS